MWHRKVGHGASYFFVPRSVARVSHELTSVWSIAQFLCFHCAFEGCHLLKEVFVWFFCILRWHQSWDQSYRLWKRYPLRLRRTGLILWRLRTSDHHLSSARGERYISMNYIYSCSTSSYLWALVVSLPLSKVPYYIFNFKAIFLGYGISRFEFLLASLVRVYRLQWTSHRPRGFYGAFLAPILFFLSLLQINQEPSPFSKNCIFSQARDDPEGVCVGGGNGKDFPVSLHFPKFL